MKKLLSVIVLAAMLVTMICPSFATPADSHDHSAEVNEFDALTFAVDDVVVSDGASTADVAVRIVGNGNHICETGIWGMAVSLYYPEDLKVVNITDGGMFSDSAGSFDLEKWNVSTPDSNTLRALNENNVEFEGMGYSYGRYVAEQKDPEGGVVDDGVLFTVTVELPADASAGDSWTIGIVANKDDVIDQGTEAVDESGNTQIEFYEIPFALDNGSVSVAAVTYNAQISVGDAVATAGKEVTVPVTIADNPGMFITRLTATYDAECLEFVSAELGSVMADSYAITNKVEDGNLTLYFEASDVADIKDDGVIVYLTFKAAETAVGDTQIALTAEDAIDVNGNDINVTLVPGAITVVEGTVVSVGNASVTATEFVEVPVEITSNSGIWALRAEFTYDADLLTFDGIKSGIFNTEKNVNYSVDNGVITVFVEDKDIADVEVDGVLFTLQFTSGRKAGNSTVAVNILDAIDAESADLDIKAVDGEIEILPAPSITVGSVEAAYNTSAVVPVSVSGNKGVVSVRMEVAYDAAALKFDGVTSGLFSADETNASAEDGVITVYVENDDVADMTEDGVLFNLVFTVLADEDADYALVATVIADSTINVGGEEVKFLAENGVVTTTAHEHEYVEDVVDATCTEAGSITVKCTICGDVQSVTEIPALGHTEGEPVAVDATCTEDGYVKVYCTVCGELLSETVVEATGHDWVAGETVAATCIEEGYTEYSCSKCEEIKVEIIPVDPDAHQAGERVVTVEPTYEAAGAYEVRCTLCGEVIESGEIPMLTGAIVTIGSVEAKCGKEVVVSVELSRNVGLSIVIVDVTYDADKLVYAGAENGEVFGGENVIFNKVADGSLRLYFEVDGDADATANGVLANLKFTVVDDIAIVGETEISAEVAEAVNYEEADIAVRTVSGIVNIVTGSVITVGDVKVNQDASVEVPVSVSRNDGLWALRAEYKYDPDMLTFEGVKSEMFTTEAGVNYSENDGVITVFVENADIDDAAADGVLYSLVFTAKRTVGETAVEVTVLEAINAAEEDIDVYAVDGTVEVMPLPAVAVGTVEGAAYGEVSVPVTIARNPGVISLRVEITYDADALEFAGVSSGLFEADEASASANDGVITVYVENAEVADMTEDGVAFYLNFVSKNKDAGEYALSATILADSTINAEGEEVLFLTEDGKVVVLAHTEHTVEVSETAATCTEDGLRTETCTVCGEVVKEEVIPALGHDMVAGEVVAPTCTEAGYTVYNCSRCDVTENRDEVPALGHTAGEVEIVTAPTCTETGVGVKKCTVCGEVVEENVVVEALGHDMVAGEVVEPTCTEAGYTVYNCSRCDVTENRDEVPALGHTAGEPVVTDPTCVDEGSKVVYCTVCGEELSREVIPATGEHTPGEPITTKYPTATEDGEAEIRCTVCGEVLDTIVLPAIGEEHEHVKAETVEIVTAPTCTEAGTGVIRCTVCGEVLETVEVDAIGHNWVAYYTVAPTCTEAGLTIYTCSNCKEIKTENVDALGHTAGEAVVVKAPTCTEAGQKVVKCTVCGEVLSSESIEALGHTAGEAVVAKAPTCTEVGQKVVKCTVCGEVLSAEEIPAIEHEWKLVYEVDPTCTAGGATIYACANCNELDTKMSDALGHTAGEAVVAKAPTCTEVGQKVVKCTVCGEVLSSESIEALGHTAGEAVVAKVPTCTEAGQKVVKCTVCGEVLSTEEIPALDHAWTEYYAVAATCTEKGIAIYVCSNCKDIKTVDIDALGHTAGNVEVITAATCTEKGQGVIKCTVCGEVLEYVELAEIPHDTSGNAPVIISHPTCTEDGITEVTCNICKQRIQLITPAKGHLESKEPVEVAPTCGKDGYRAIICLECGEIIGEVLEVLPATGDHNWEKTSEVPASTKADGYIEYTCSVCGDTRRETLPKLKGIYGDVNDDGEVDADDAIYLLYCTTLGDAAYPFDKNVNNNGDFNGDGEVDADDAIYLLYSTTLPDMYPLVDPRA